VSSVAAMVLGAAAFGRALGPVAFALTLMAIAVVQVAADITVRGLWTRSAPVLRQTFSGRLGQPQLLPEARAPDREHAASTD
jgi:hypothetical protein